MAYNHKITKPNREQIASNNSVIFTHEAVM